MQLANTALRFGLVAVALHWLIALLFLAMIAIGLTMTSLPLVHPWTFPLYQLHKSIGVTIFALVVLRLAWRVAGQVPPLPVTLKPWERAAAYLTHYGLYAVLLAMPLTGWITVSASPYGIPTILYGYVKLPHLGFVVANAHKAAIEMAASWTHWGLAWTAIALVALHIAAALKHHFILNDDVLTRMLPSRAHFEKRSPR
ncbi:MAG TPA: cytochrome b [Parvibaculum sp.]